MGRMHTLVNFTKREKICVGKPGEEPVFQILKEMKTRFQWDLESDQIELVDSENLWIMGYATINEDDDERGISTEEKKQDDGMRREVFLDREAEFPWRERSRLWRNLPRKESESSL